MHILKSSYSVLFIENVIMRSYYACLSNAEIFIKSKEYVYEVEIIAL